MCSTATSPSVAGLVREHRLADHVADRVDVLDRNPATVRERVAYLEQFDRVTESDGKIHPDR
jgi:hypothetical protein